MSKIEIREKRKKLLKASIGLQRICIECEDKNKAIKLRKQQKEVYNKYVFFDKLIKELDSKK